MHQRLRDQPGPAIEAGRVRRPVHPIDDSDRGWISTVQRERQGVEADLPCAAEVIDEATSPA